MKQEQKENIIRDLLYEVSARNHLSSQSKKAKKRLPSYYWMAAAASFLLVMAYLGWQDGSSTFDQRKEWITANYQFPEINKSRSSNLNVVDEYVTELKDGKYKQVLESLDRDSLSEKDLFVKAHLHFTTNEMDDAIEILRNNEWSEEYQKDILWLDFIIQYKSGASKKTLKALAKDLSLNHKTKATELLNR